ncbi:MAG: hypothetical protein J7L46_04895 [Bacteroidales bacterium]|nr:hypothetical protein [Bacteroidales bacterium]
MEFLVAFATDNGKSFMSRHFGDAEFYDIYKISKIDTEFLERIENITEEEKQHADPEKAKGIVSLLKKKGVQVAVSKNFGPNIQRIKSVFVCIRIKEDLIEDGTKIIQKHLQPIYYEWLLDEKRDFLKL